MKNVILAVIAVMAIAGFSSCQKSCAPGFVYDPQAPNGQGGYGDCVAKTNTGCTSCGGNGGGSNGTPIGWQPDSAYHPTNDYITVFATVCDIPGDQTGTDFQRRKEARFGDDFTVIPDFDRDTYVDALIAGTGWDNNKSSCWAYSADYGYIQFALSKNTIGSLQKGAQISIVLSLNYYLPFAVWGDVANVRNHEAMVNYSLTNACWAKYGQ